MKFIFSIFSILFLSSFAEGKEIVYIGSTPAGPVVKSFLGIPLADSVDFIRWNLIFRNNQFELHCNYGIGKPNTNGFINGGKKIDMKGDLKKEKNNYGLQNAGRTLWLVELNGDLLYLLDNERHLLVGNGGWSYILNNTSPSHTDQVTLTAGQTTVRDSIAFQGRTPCGIPGIIPPGTDCYKLKWYIVLYGNANRKDGGKYKILGTPWREKGPRTGNWSMVTGKNGRIIYQLNDEQGKALIYFLKLDEHILIFTDTAGKLLVGDEDFSYTMNRTR